MAPAVLLLPTAAMLLSLTVVTGAVCFSNLVLTKVEKQSINRWCAERFGSYSVGRFGSIFAPKPYQLWKSLQ